MVYEHLLHSKRKQLKRLAVLIDPDKVGTQHLYQIADNAKRAGADYIFVGGSLVMDDIKDCVKEVKESCDLPVILFPGSLYQVTDEADALFFLSLISGRNPDLLIGHHVIAAPLLRNMELEVMPTGYMLIDGGAPTTVSYISNSHPIPADKPQIAVCTAMAGEMLGHKVIYMDAGSGAKNPISAAMVKAVSQTIDIPLVIGGGIRTPEIAVEIASAGAEVIVVGNAFEKDPNLIGEMAEAIHAMNVLQ